MCTPKVSLIFVFLIFISIDTYSCNLQNNTNIKKCKMQDLVEALEDSKHPPRHLITP